MKQVASFVVMALVLMSFFGCAGGPSPEEKSAMFNEKYRLDSFDMQLKEKFPVKECLGGEELKQKAQEALGRKLSEKGLLSSEGEKDIYVNINATFQRVHVGEDTPIPSESLGVPTLGYTIKFYDVNKNLLHVVDKQGLQVQYGLAENMKIMAMQRKCAADVENHDIEVLTNTIVKEMQRLQKK